jgi:hypothetical protein
MDKEIERSLERIIEYLFWDEIRDWEAQGKPRKQIFTDVRRVDRWLGELRKRSVRYRTPAENPPRRASRTLRGISFYGARGGRYPPPTHWEVALNSCSRVGLIPVVSEKGQLRRNRRAHRLGWDGRIDYRGEKLAKRAGRILISHSAQEPV